MAPSSREETRDVADAAVCLERVLLGEAISASCDRVRARLDLRNALAPRLNPEEIREAVAAEIEEAACVATRAVGKWLTSFSIPTDEELSHATAASRHAVSGAVAFSDVLKWYLRCRDVLLEIVGEEASRLETSRAVVLEASAAVVHGCDRSLVRLARTVEDQRQGLEAALARERHTLAHNAAHDSLTGLVNRRSLVEALEQAIATMDESGSVAVLFIDLDRFKRINDELGHIAGDELLVEIGARLRRQVRPYDTVARLGGDEFVVVCEELPADASVVLGVADRIAKALAKPVKAGGGEARVTASVGIRLVSKDTSADLAMADADAAMYLARERAATA